jgi:hypothetical protein
MRDFGLSHPNTYTAQAIRGQKYECVSEWSQSGDGTRILGMCHDREETKAEIVFTSRSLGLRADFSQQQDMKLPKNLFAQLGVWAPGMESSPSRRRVMSTECRRDAAAPWQEDNAWAGGGQCRVAVAGSRVTTWLQRETRNQQCSLLLCHDHISQKES